MSRLVDISNYQFSEWTKQLPTNCLIDRDEEILAHCRNKTVLHIGAADSPFDEKKARQGTLLHQKLMQNSRRVVGVDVDAKAISRLNLLGIDNIVTADFCEVDPFPGETFDVVLCCDVIEHVRQPGTLLDACCRYLHDESKLVVTTINATALKPALRALVGREAVHGDHVAYYSFSTLGKLLTISGLQPVEFGVFAYPTLNRTFGVLTEYLMHARSGSADGIMMNARRL